MRRSLFCALGLAGSGILGAQPVQPGKRVKDTTPAQSWVGRLDPAAERRGANITENTLLQSGDGLRVTTVVPAIYWRAANLASGTYIVKADFAQARGSATEFHGLFLGGRQLQKGVQNYLYCGVAGNGTFAVRHINGPEVNELAGRTASVAIRKANAEGRATNQVALKVTLERTSCVVNGTEVWGYATKALTGPGRLASTDGLVGIRVNQALDVEVTGFTITGT
ncbi:MAG: hypothetical protein IPK85_11560 [Gemmatimonadetes bacterium]|nr:hypothetical protein [Gemmatimonadota bacterium]